MSTRTHILEIMMVVVIMMLSLSCTDEPEEAVPDPYNATGEWYGRIGDDIVRMSLSQTSLKSITGSVYWEPLLLRDTLTSGVRVNDKSVQLRVTSRFCTYVLTGNFVAKNRIQGEYYYRCSPQPPVWQYWSIQKVTVLPR